MRDFLTGGDPTHDPRFPALYWLSRLLTMIRDILTLL